MKKAQGGAGGESPVDRMIEVLGGGRRSVVARSLGVSSNAVRKWQQRGRLPRTEWTGETNYAWVVEKLTGGQVTRSFLLGFVDLHDAPPSDEPGADDAPVPAAPCSGTCRPAERGAA